MKKKEKEIKEPKIVKNEEKQSTKKIDKEKIKNKVNQFFNSIGFPIMIGILLLLKTIYFYQDTISIRETIDKETILGTIAFLSTIVCLICTLPNKGRIITTIIVDVLLSVLLLADNLYHTYSSSVLSVAQILNLQYGEEIMNTIPMLMQLEKFLYFIDMILVGILLVVKVLKIEKKEALTLKKQIIKIAVCLVLVIGLLGVDGTFIERAKEDPFNKDMQVKKSTIYGYHIADIENTINIKKQAKYTNKEKLLEDINRTQICSKK